MECATANQAPQSQADSQSGHGTSGPHESSELHVEDISEEIMNFSLQEIAASFSPSMNWFFFFCLGELCLSGNFILPHAKEMFPLSPLPIPLSLSFCLSVRLPSPPLSLTPVMGKEPEQEFLCLWVLFG